MSRRSPTIAVVGDHYRVGRALVAYLSSDGSAAAQVIGPYTYHADQEQFRHAQAILRDLDSCDPAAAFHLMELVAAARTYPYLPSAPARPSEPRPLPGGQQHAPTSQRRHLKNWSVNLPTSPLATGTRLADGRDIFTVACHGAPIGAISQSVTGSWLWGRQADAEGPAPSSGNWPTSFAASIPRQMTAMKPGRSANAPASASANHGAYRTAQNGEGPDAGGARRRDGSTEGGIDHALDDS